MAVLRACSPIATALLALLLLPRPVTAVPHNHGHKHVHRHVSPANDLITLGPESLARRDTPLNTGDLPRFSDKKLLETAHSCLTGPQELPLNDGVPNPVDITTIEQLNVFSRPESVAGTVTMHNYCGYDLWWFHYSDNGEIEHGHLPAGGTVAKPAVGSVMKVTKTNALGRELLVEYCHDKKDPSILWYNLSLIVCIGKEDSKITTDTTQCAGHEAGIQLGQSEFAFQCEAGKWCDDQAYFYGVSRQLLRC